MVNYIKTYDNIYLEQQQKGIKKMEMQLWELSLILDNVEGCYDWINHIRNEITENMRNHAFKISFVYNMCHNNGERGMVLTDPNLN